MQEFQYYIGKLGDSYFILGEFNAHSTKLDTTILRTNFTGRTLDTLLEDEDVCLINPINFYTYLSPATGKKSCLDVCLSSADITPHLEMSLGQDVGSDHMPVHIYAMLDPVKTQINTRKRWKIKTEDIPKFRDALKITELVLPSSTDDIVRDFNERIQKSADTAFHVAQQVQTKKRTCWWDEECSEAVRTRRRARRNLEQNPNEENVELLKQATAEARRVCKKKKRESFREYISDLQHDTPIGEVWRKIKSIKTSYQAQTYPLVNNNSPIIDDLQKANMFSQHYMNVSSLSQYQIPTDMNAAIKTAKKGGKNEEYNRKFFMIHSIEVYERQRILEKKTFVIKSSQEHVTLYKRHLMLIAV